MSQITDYKFDSQTKITYQKDSFKISPFYPDINNILNISTHSNDSFIEIS